MRMKTINPLLSHQAAKAMKPRNPVLIALKHSQGAKAGAHRKKQGALRRAEKMAVLRALHDL